MEGPQHWRTHLSPRSPGSLDPSGFFSLPEPGTLTGAWTAALTPDPDRPLLWGLVGGGPARWVTRGEFLDRTVAAARQLSVAGLVAGDRVLEQAFGPSAGEIFDRTRQVQIIACGTSYHAGLVAKHWLEYVGVPCEVEVASEYRYRRHVTRSGTLVVTISQSGETADTLAALTEAVSYTHLTLPTSDLV